MLSRREGRSYVVLFDGERLPSKMNAKAADAAVRKIGAALATIRDELKKAYDGDPEIYRMLRDEIFERSSYRSVSCSDGKCSAVDDMLWSVGCLKESLEGPDDEIRPYEETVTLRDLGFCDRFSKRGFWEKVMKDDDEEEIVEEIQNYADPIRRIRTTEWEKTDYGKASKSIKYRKIPIGKKLMKAIANTAKAEGFEDG